MAFTPRGGRGGDRGGARGGFGVGRGGDRGGFGGRGGGRGGARGESYVMGLLKNSNSLALPNTANTCTESMRPNVADQRVRRSR